MMIVFYDEKHQQILNKLKLGNISYEEKTVVESVLNYVNDRIDSRYIKFELCESVETVYDEDGNTEIKFYY